MIRPSRVATPSIAVALVYVCFAASACITTVEVQGTGDGGVIVTSPRDGATGTLGGGSSGNESTDSDGSTSSSGDDDRSGDDASTSSGDDDASTSSGDDDAAPTPIGKMYSGQATTYTANGASACGPTLSDSQLVAALSSDVYSRAECGKCIRVTGPNGSVTVTAEDLCPGCHDESLDLSSTAFEKIADLSAGRVSITWYYVACD